MVLRRFKRYLALTGAERWLFLRAWIWLAVIDLTLRAFGFRRLVQPPSRLHVATNFGASASAVLRARRYAHWLEIASRHHLAKAHCLHRSLALHHWLRQEGWPSNVRIGVRKSKDELQAHAWVELEEQVVNDLPAVVAAFTPLTDPGLLDLPERNRRDAARERLLVAIDERR